MSHLAIFVSIWLQKTIAGDNSGANIFIIKNYLKLSGRLQAEVSYCYMIDTWTPCIDIPSEPQGLGASEIFFYYIIQQGEELTCLHFF